MIKRIVLAWLLIIVGITCLKVHADDLPLLGVSNSKTVSGGTTAFDAGSWASATGAAVACGQAASSCVNGGSQTTLTWTHTPVGTPTCVVLMWQNNNLNLNTPTYGGVSMTSAGTSSFTNFSGTLQTWYLAGPSSGPQTVSIVDGLGTFGFVTASAVTFTGTGTNCYRTASFKAKDLTGTTTLTNSGIAGATNDLVVDFVGVDTGGTLTPGGGQTIVTCRGTSGACTGGTLTGGNGSTTSTSSASASISYSSSISQEMNDVAISVQHQ